jgi:hypothetical protein
MSRNEGKYLMELLKIKKTRQNAEKENNNLLDCYDGNYLKLQHLLLRKAFFDAV